jgi:hypothetical protein
LGTAEALDATIGQEICGQEICGQETRKQETRPLRVGLASEHPPSPASRAIGQIAREASLGGLPCRASNRMIPPHLISL